MRETYALDLDDLLMSVNLAIGTYRKAVSTTIPELTRMAWRDHRAEIEQRSPGITEQAFVYTLPAEDYDRDFGTEYRKPGFFARLLSVLLKIVPKVGPFRPLAFEPLSAEVARLFLESTEAARERYRAALRAVRRPDFDLPDTDFDTGAAPAAGRNRLADKTYADLLHTLAKRKFADVPEPLGRHLKAFFDAEDREPRRGHSERANPRVQRELRSLAARHTGS